MNLNAVLAAVEEGHAAFLRNAHIMADSPYAGDFVRGYALARMTMR